MRKLALILSTGALAAFLFLSFQSTAGSLYTQKLMTNKYSKEEARRTGKKIIAYHPYGVVQLYAAMMYFCDIQKDPETALLFIDAIQKGVVPEYGNIEGYKGDFLLQLGKVDEACKAYWKDGENYPLSVVPIYKLMRIAALKGNYQQAENLKNNLEARKKARAINEKMFLYILQRPYFDLHPWMIPKVHGGQESERSFKYQKIGTSKAGDTF